MVMVEQRRKWPLAGGYSPLYGWVKLF